MKKKKVAENTVTIRKLGSDKQEVMKRQDLIKNMLDLNKNAFKLSVKFKTKLFSEKNKASRPKS